MAVPKETLADNRGTEMAAVQRIRTDPAQACVGLAVLATG